MVQRIAKAEDPLEACPGDNLDPLLAKKAQEVIETACDRGRSSVILVQHHTMLICKKTHLTLRAKSSLGPF
jgi:hypothetical protein